jgi:preprotein translocase subunit YajC
MPTATVFFAIVAATSKKTTSGSSGFATIIFLLLIFAVLYVFMIRPRQAAARRQRDTLLELSAGDEVLTGAGIFGTVLDVEPDRVTLETAPGTRITVVRSTIARRITEQDASSVSEQNWNDEHHDGVAEAAGWHDPSEHETDEHESTAGHDTDGGHPALGGHEGTEDEPDADGAPGTAQGGGR